MEIENKLEMEISFFMIGCLEVRLFLLHVL